MVGWFVFVLAAVSSFQLDDIVVTPIFHASFMLQWNGKVIHIDPWSKGDYRGIPKADVVLITHAHPDHLDLNQIAALRKPDTVIIAPADAAHQISGAHALNNGETTNVGDVLIEAVPMYNIKRGPSAGTLYHPKGVGNGYIITLGQNRLYISGDTECTDEIKALRNIDIAFLCMNLPYTMPPEEAAVCANAFRPRVVIPYHYRESSLDDFRRHVSKDIEVPLLEWYPTR